VLENTKLGQQLDHEAFDNYQCMIAQPMMPSKQNTLSALQMTDMGKWWCLLRQFSIRACTCVTVHLFYALRKYVRVDCVWIQ
jgi:hypothetical protein